MSCFAFMRGSKNELLDTPFVDGQFFMITDQYDGVDLSKYNGIYMDSVTRRKELGINAWQGLSAPFKRIDNNNLIVVNGVLTYQQNWNSIINKPFETIGTNLFVKNGQLRLAILWDNIENKPFYTVGAGLNVDEYGNLNADVISASLRQVGTASSSTFSYQYLLVNTTDVGIEGSKYMEYTQTLSTTQDTQYTFNNIDIDDDSVIEVYTSVWGINPSNIEITSNRCVVTFPKVNASNTDLKCRIYIRKGWLA